MKHLTKEQIEAAKRYVKNAALTGWTNESLAKFLTKSLPNYTVSLDGETGVRCVSNTGMDDLEWGRLKATIKIRYKVSEFYSRTNYRHKDFTVFLKNNN
jgi:hypothetical protein